MHQDMRYKKGSALIYGLTIVTIAAVIFVGIISFVISQVKYSLREEPKNESLQIAEAGAFFYRWHLAHVVDGKTAQEIEDYWKTSNNPLAVDDNDDGDCEDADTADGDGQGTEAYEVDYEGIGSYRICVTRPAIGTTIALVHVEGWLDGEEDDSRKIQMRMRRPAWSEFAILSDAPLDLENTTKQVFIDGKIHSNGGVRFDQNGVAYNTVSSSVDDYDYNGQTRPGVWIGDNSDNVIVNDTSVFPAGKSFPVPSQDYNAVIVSFGQMFDNADFNKGSGKEVHITFNTNNGGEAEVCDIHKTDKDSQRIKSHKKNSCDTISLGATTVFYVKQRIWVDGIVAQDKKISIVSEHQGGGNKKDSIYINGDLVQEDTSSDSVIGLVAEEGVKIIEDPLASPAVAGGGDLNANGILDIDAAILSAGGPFERYSSYSDMNADIYMYGAIATKEGINLNGIDDFTLSYDQRLINAPPPFFPTGGSYLIDQWEEVW